MSKRGAIQVCAFAAALLALSVLEAAARTITVGWEASPDAPVAGYRVYWSTQSGTYSETDYFDVGAALTWTGDLPGDQYYFVVRSYSADGTVGPPSLEAGDTRDFWLSNPGDQSNDAGQAVHLPLFAYGRAVTYRADGLPAGLVVDAATGEVFGTLGAPEAPVVRQVVTAAAVDTAGHVSSVQFYWTVRTNHSPLAAAPGNQTSVRGDAVLLQIDASDPDGDRLQYSATHLPPGLTIDAATGRISGTVSSTAAGVFDASVAVSDGRLAATVAFAWRILVNDPVPAPAVSVSIGDASVREGGDGSVSMNFTATLSAASAVPVSVHYQTVDGTAKAGADYAAKSATLLFPAGTTTQMIGVTIFGDRNAEAAESFTVVLSGPTNGVIADGRGVGTILNDDTESQMFGFGAIVEGRARHRFVFRVRDRKQRDDARLEFWSTEPVKGKGVDDDDRSGSVDRDYRHDHKTAKNRFESASIAGMTFGPRERDGQSVVFSGAGSWNGKSGYTFEARAGDRGEPGRGRDTFALVIKDSRGAVVLNVSGTLDDGNIEAISSSKRW